MADLKRLLTNLIKGKGSFEEVSAAVDQVLAQSPDKAPYVAKLLKAARDAGLPIEVYAALRGSIPQESSPEDADATVFATDDQYANADKTVLAVDDSADKTVLASDDDQEEKTVVARDDGEDATVVEKRPAKPSEPRDFREEPTQMEAAVDEDATALNLAVSPTDTTEMNVANLGDPDATQTNEAVDDDATLVNKGVDDDATQVNKGVDDDATAVNVAADPDKTAVTGAGAGGADDDFDILSDEAMTAAQKAAESTTGSNTGASWPTAVGGVPPSGGAGISREFRENDRLRNRFELISKLGEGGMGAVWKGKDLLKEEARDRNPYVAIKLLQGDFKEHPEAFIALQRETAKQQRLAHPNVATVFDFDRDDNTNTVFMTMEVLEGQPMDSFIRKLPAGGLEPEEAMPLIEQLCNGLAYAHSHGLVHSDLKPGNCFYTKDGSLKLLDFGIARASKTKGDAEGETTLFDPGQLGALTPTYATIEMFDGKDPDPRDDIYALAIMSYQLLTGKHPYGKKSAPKAKELGLKPEPVPKLSKRQNKGLMRGLEFLREDRTPSVNEFFEDIRPKKSRAPAIAAAVAVLAVIIGAGAYAPVKEYFNQITIDGYVQQIQKPGLENIRGGLEMAKADESAALFKRILFHEDTVASVVKYLIAGGERTIDETLKLLDKYDPEFKKVVLDNEKAKKAILGVFEAKIDEAFNVKQNRYQYTVAQTHINRLKTIYTDSAQVLQIETGLKSEKEQTLADLNADFTRYLDEGRLLPVETERDINDVITIVKQIDPKHHLLTDDRLRFRYGELADQAIKEKDYARADALLTASAVYAPKDSKLNDLRFQVQSELQRIKNEKWVAEIEQRLGLQLSSLRSLSDFQRVRDDLVVLADLSPDSKLFKQAQATLKQAFSSELNKDIAAKAWPASEKLLVDFSKLFDIPYLTQQRQLLSSAEQKAGYAFEMTPERKAAVDQRVKAIETLLASPEFSTDWEIKLKVPYKELIALVPQGDPTFEQIRNNTARLYLEKAKTALDNERFVESLAFVDRGRVFYPGLKNFADFEQAIAKSQDAWRKKREEEQRLARIEALKKQFIAATERNDVKDADEKIAAIKAEGVPASDPFLATEAPTKLAESYLRLAQGRVEDKDNQDYKQALALAKRGLEIAPQLEALQAAVRDYEIEVGKRQLEIALRELFDSTDDIDVASTRKSLETLKANFPSRYPALLQEFAGDRGNQIRGMANAKALQVTEIPKRLSEYENLFPSEAAKVRNDVSAIIEKRIGAVNISKAEDVDAISAALGLLKSINPGTYQSLQATMTRDIAARVKALEPSDPSAASRLLSASINAFGQAKAFEGMVVRNEHIIAGQANLKQNKLMTAKANLESAKKEAPNHPDLAGFERLFNEKMGAADGKYNEYKTLAGRKQPKSRHDDIQAIRNQALALCNDCAQYAKLEIEQLPRGYCSEDLAGFGGRSAGQCYDVLGRAKGPVLVVVPPGGGADKHFAISKYEISGSDYNDYCRATKSCSKSIDRKSAKLPLTGISLQEAEAFAAWLSEEASKTAGERVVYRLPTEAEWEYAATANGKQPEKNYNCRVKSGDQIIAGFALIDTTSGQQNGWGLANYVGNAQEWVKSGNGIKVRGGAFEDPLTRCDISLTRAHSGQPDPLTGFRLVREMGS